MLLSQESCFDLKLLQRMESWRSKFLSGVLVAILLLCWKIVSKYKLLRRKREEDNMSQTKSFQWVRGGNRLAAEARRDRFRNQGSGRDQSEPRAAGVRRSAGAGRAAGAEPRRARGRGADAAGAETLEGFEESTDQARASEAGCKIFARAGRAAIGRESSAADRGFETSSEIAA